MTKIDRLREYFDATKFDEMVENLKFNATWHTYSWKEQKVKFMSCSALNAYSTWSFQSFKKELLERLGEVGGNLEFQKIMNNAGKRGKQLHYFAENVVGENADMPTALDSVAKKYGTDNISKATEKKFLPFFDWIKENILSDEIEVLAIELKVADIDIKVAGTMDLLIFNKATETFEVWDFKSSEFKSAKMSEWKYAPQLLGYVNILKSLLIPKKPTKIRAFIVHVHEKITKLEIGTNAVDWNGEKNG